MEGIRNIVGLKHYLSPKSKVYVDICPSYPIQKFRIIKNVKNFNQRNRATSRLIWKDIIALQNTVCDRFALLIKKNNSSTPLVGESRPV